VLVWREGAAGASGGLARVLGGLTRRALAGLVSGVLIRLERPGSRARRRSRGYAVVGGVVRGGRQRSGQGGSDDAARYKRTHHARNRQGSLGWAQMFHLLLDWDGRAWIQPSTLHLLWRRQPFITITGR